VNRVFSFNIIKGGLLTVLFLIAGQVWIFGTYQHNDVDILGLRSERFRNFSIDISSPILFASEEIPINNLNVRAIIENELLLLLNNPVSTKLLMRRAERWFPIIEEELKANNIHSDFKYLTIVESGLTYNTSRHGASGFWQFIEKSAGEFKLIVNEDIDERYNVRKSTKAACRYFKQSHKQLNSWILAAASFNSGIGRLTREMARQDNQNYFDLNLNPETARYIYRIIAVKEIFENKEKYSQQLITSKLKNFRTESVKLKAGKHKLKQLAKAHNTSSVILSILNPWILSGEFHIDSDDLILLVPKEDEIVQKNLAENPEEFGYFATLTNLSSETVLKKNNQINDTIPASIPVKPKHE
jgi:membrane-bound lytic murein transglycosylase D